MNSIQSKIISFLFRLINKKSFLKKQLNKGRFDLFTCEEPPAKVFINCTIEKYRIDGHKVFTLIPKNNRSTKHILYLHGGAYVQGFVRPHWDFLSLLIDNLKCTITAPDYPLAPTYTYKESFKMVGALYKKLISTVEAKDLILMGDSAGGGFALSLAQMMRIEEIKQPGQIILLSPWLDIGLTNPGIKAIDLIDPFLSVESLRQAGQLYSGGTTPAHYLLSPINGPLEGLGKLSVFIGSSEILVADARKLKELMESRGIDLNYFEYPDMFHVWMLLNLPESKKAKKQILALLKES